MLNLKKFNKWSTCAISNDLSLTLQLFYAGPLHHMRYAMQCHKKSILEVEAKVEDELFDKFYI